MPPVSLLLLLGGAGLRELDEIGGLHVKGLGGFDVEHHVRPLDPAPRHLDEEELLVHPGCPNAVACMIEELHSDDSGSLLWTTYREGGIPGALTREVRFVQDIPLRS